MCTFLLVAWLFGCEKQSPDAPPVAPPPGPGGGNRAHECASADDCALSNLESASDCCGDPCNSGFAYSKGELATLEAARTAVCARKDVECPVADCNFPTNFYPGCVRGECVAIELPRRTECATDDDCVLSCFAPKDCCASCECDTAWTKADLARAEHWRTEQCSTVDCPMAKCAATEKVAHCDNGWCVAK